MWFTWPRPIPLSGIWKLTASLIFRFANWYCDIFISGLVDRLCSNNISSLWWTWLFHTGTRLLLWYPNSRSAYYALIKKERNSTKTQTASINKKSSGETNKKADGLHKQIKRSVGNNYSASSEINPAGFDLFIDLFHYLSDDWMFFKVTNAYIPFVPNPPPEI